MNINRVLSITVLALFIFLGLTANYLSGDIDKAAASDQAQRIAPAAAGVSHSLAIDKDGTVWTWGRNSYNQLGLGRTSSGAVASAMKVVDITDIVAVTAGTNHTIALQRDGTVWGWGNNAGGQLGDGSPIRQQPFSTMTPVKAKNITDIIAVAAGAKDYTIALKKDGTVWTWGSNVYSNIGDGTTSDRYEPVMVSGFNDAVAIGAGVWHSMLVRADGTVWVWGYNSDGQFGDGVKGNRSNVPLQVMYVPDINKPEDKIPFAGVKKADGGLSHSIALKYDGTVWAWGYNAHGQLGDGTWTDSLYPTQVLDLTNVIDIAAGSGFNLALRADGTVWAWGQGQKGEHGQFSEATGPLGADGQPAMSYVYGEAFHHHLDRNVPIQLPGLKNITSIAAGANHGIAVDKNGVVWTWGFNDYGQIGNGFVQAKGYPLSNPVSYLGGGPAVKLTTIMQPQMQTQPQPQPQPQSSVSPQPSMWAVAEIEAAKGYGLITDKVLSNYQTPITRGEFCELAVKLYEALSGQKAQPSPANVFSDTGNPEILKAYNLGIVNGVGGGRFAPDNQVTREQIAVMFYHTMEAVNPHMSSPAAPASTFTDAGQVSGWAREAVTDMSSRGIIGGVGEGRFDPKGNATREQAIALVKRVYESLR